MILGDILAPPSNSNSRTAARLSLRPDRGAHDALHGRLRREGGRRSGRTVATWPSDRYKAAVEVGRQAYEAAAAPLGDRSAFIDLNRGSDHDDHSGGSSRFRAPSISILARVRGGVPVPAQLPDETILDIGRPTLVVPYVRQSRGRRPSAVCLAKHARACPRRFRRAAAARAKRRGAHRRGGPQERAARRVRQLLVADLPTHGVSARYQHFVVEIAVMDTLLSAVRPRRCDLLAIGAFDQGTHALCVPRLRHAPHSRTHDHAGAFSD